MALDSILSESRQADAVIAFSGRGSGAVFYPGRPDGLKLPGRCFTFAVKDGCSLGFHCVFSENPEVEGMIERSPVEAAAWLLKNGESFAVRDGEGWVVELMGGGRGASPFATFSEADDYNGYEEAEVGLGRPFGLAVDSEDACINKGKLSKEVKMSEMDEGKTWKSEPFTKKGRWKINEEGDQPAAPQPAPVPASPAEPPPEGEPTVEQIVAEFVDAVKGKFPRLETSELENLIMTAFKTKTDSESDKDTVPADVAAEVVQEAMRFCKEYNEFKPRPGLKLKSLSE